MNATSTDLDAELDSHRRALTGFCYRMLGSASEADDAVQETLLRAWRSIDSHEGRSSLRTWLFRIAHNVCIDMHRSPQRRARPTDLGPSSRAAEAVLGDPRADRTWVGPIPDERVIDPATDPAELAVARESIRLAFVAALQHLPARQRATLILCDVLRWPAAEAAALLDTTTAAVNSMLQRARATLEERRDAAGDLRLDPTLGHDHEVLLARYVDAFERYDIDALVALMRDDAVLTMPPHDLWLQGADELAAWMAGPGIDCAGARLVPCWVNGTAGFGNYRVSGPGRWEPFGIQVVECRDGRISAQHNFLYPEWFADFGLPAVLTEEMSGRHR